MKSMTIRDLRHHWPAAEAALKMEEEILITRDSKPIAKLVRLPEQLSKRVRWDPEDHKKWLKGVWRNKEVLLVEKYLYADRQDRSAKVAP